MSVRIAAVLICLATFGVANAQSASASMPLGEAQGSGPNFSAVSELPDEPTPAAAKDQQAKTGQADDTANAPGLPEPIKNRRVLWIFPAYQTEYRTDVPPLTARKKITVAFRSAADPVTLGIAFVVAGYHEAKDDYGSGYGWGAEGYFKRTGAAYVDSIDSTILGMGVVPALFRQDPRYFRMGHGRFLRRLTYAAVTSTVVCKGDKSRKWQPNVSNLTGNLAAGAISNLYYPDKDTGGRQTVENGALLTAEGAIGGLFQEFWPDVSRKLFHNDPTHGLDKQAREADHSGQHKQTQPIEPSPK